MMRYNSNHSLESIDFWFGYDHDLEVLNLPMSSSLHKQPEDLAVALNKFRALKSLDLSRHKTACRERNHLHTVA